MKQDFTQTVAQRMIKITPDLAHAPPEKIHRKAKRAIWVFFIAGAAVVLVAAGAYLSYGFAKSAIAQEQPVSLGLMFAILVPILPGSVVGLIAAMRFDPDAGGAFQQLITLAAAARQAIKPSKPVA